MTRQSSAAAHEAQHWPDEEAGEELRPLPATSTTLHGQTFDPREIVWALKKRPDGGSQLALDWRTLAAFSPRAVHLARLMLAARAPSQAALTVRNDYETLRRFATWWSTQSPGASFDWGLMSVVVARTFLAHGLTTASLGNDFARVRDLYRHGVDHRLSREFRADILLRMERIRAPGNAKGNAVRQGDPKQGYFTPPEVDDILQALAKTDERKDAATVRLCLEIGRNSLQYTLLTNADLRRVSATAPGATAPEWIYHLLVRRTKKRTIEDEKRPWPVSTDLGDLLWNLRRGGPDERLLWWVDERDPEQSLRKRMQAWATRIDLRAARTGEIMVMNPRRFRVTMLTNAADEGASMEALALMADHVDLQNVPVYVDRSPRFLTRIAPKVDAIYDPIVRRFRGEVIDRAAHTDKPMIPGVAVQIGLNVGGIGRCGRGTPCSFAPPITCYGCPSFLAWQDGPHREVVASLETAMESMGDRIALQLAGALADGRALLERIAKQSMTDAP